MLNKYIFRINDGILGQPADAMAKLAARDDNGEAVCVRKPNDRVVSTHREDCEAVHVESERVKPKGKCKHSFNQVANWDFGLAAHDNNVKSVCIPELDDQAASAR